MVDLVERATRLADSLETQGAYYAAHTIRELVAELTAAHAHA